MDRQEPEVVMVLPNLVAAEEDTYSRVLCDQHDGVLRV
ncbi:enoyl-CoA hydratase, partial [Rhodococcus wratislaviensis IFP 2016]